MSTAISQPTQLFFAAASSSKYSQHNVDALNYDEVFMTHLQDSFN